MSGRSRDPRAQVTENKYDTEAWAQLVREAQSRLPTKGIHELRDLYEEILAIFPTAANYWKAYAEAELAANNIAEVKSVFARCLKCKCPSVDLWRSYLGFMKKMYGGQGGGADWVQLQRAYDYTLDQVGQDIASGVIWQEYVTFLKSPKPGSPPYAALFGGVSGQEESKRIVTLRRVYQKALVVPTNSIDNLWRSYESFEKEVGKHLAAPMLNEFKHKYQAARTVLLERKKLLEKVKWNAMALPLSCKSIEMEQQAAIWQQYVAYEASNPQQLEKAGLQGRVTLAFDQALMFMYHMPEFWYEAAVWHVTNPLGGGVHQAGTIFHRARMALPGCSMLRFVAAEVEEAAALVAKEKGEEVEVTRHSTAAEAVYKELVGEGEDPTDALDDPEQRALAWIMYMRFARRSVGVQLSREVFGRARKWEGCTWQVWAASALMEWERSKEEKVARNIFEAGFKKFGSNPEFVDAYVDFLLGIGDAINVRTLYERALQANTDVKVTKLLWDGFLKFEYRFGTLEAYQALEARRREASTNQDQETPLPPPNALELLGLRYRAFDLWPAAGATKEYMQAKVAGKPWGEAPALPAPAPTPPNVPTTEGVPRPVAAAAATAAALAAAAAAGRGEAAKGNGQLPSSIKVHTESDGGGTDRRKDSGGRDRDRGGHLQPGGVRAPDRSGLPPGGGQGPGAGPGGLPVPRLPPATQMPGPNEPLKQLPAALGLFINALPQGPVEGKVPPADLVVDIIMATDIEALAAAAEAEAATPPPVASHPPDSLPQHVQGYQGGAGDDLRGGGMESPGQTVNPGKRKFDGAGGYGGHQPPGHAPDNRPPAFDIYRQRRKQKILGSEASRG